MDIVIFTGENSKMGVQSTKIRRVPSCKSTVLAVVGLFAVSGCAELSDRVVNNVESGALIAQSCQSITDAYPIPSKDIKNYFKVRLQVRFTGCTRHDGPACRADHNVIVADLEALKEKWEDTITYVRGNPDLSNAVSRLESIKTDFETLIGDLETRTSDIRASIKAIIDRLDFKPGDCTFRSQCAERLAEALEQSKASLDDIKAKLEATRTQANTLRNGLLALPGELRGDARASGVLNEAEALVRALNAFLQKALGIISATGDYRLSVKPFIDDMFYAYVSYEVADNSLKALDRLLKPMERTVDRADQHAYGLITLGLFLADAELQGLIEKGLKDRSRKIFEKLNKNHNKLSLALSFARASCTRLIETKSDDLESPFLAQSLHRMFIVIGQEELDAAAKTPGDSAQKSEESYVSAQQLQKGLLIAKMKADLNGAGGELSPVTHNVFDRAGVCARTEWEVDKYGLGTERARTITGKVCGRFLADLDLERFRRLNAAVAAKDADASISQSDSTDESITRLKAMLQKDQMNSLNILSATKSKLELAIEAPLEGAAAGSGAAYYGEVINGALRQSTVSDMVRQAVLPSAK